jgi:hypothetical protein
VWTFSIDPYQDIKIKTRSIFQGLFLPSGRSARETATEFLGRAILKDLFLSVSSNYVYHSLFPWGQGPILFPNGYAVAFILNTGTMDTVHRVNDAKCDTVTSESRRILKVLIWTKGVALHVLHIYGKWCERGTSTCSIVRTGQVFLLYRFEGCWNGALYLFCLF